MSDAGKKRGKHKTPGKPALSVRELRFCAAVAEGKSQYEAYTSCFPPKETREANDKAASRLVRKREIRAKVREMQAEAADAAQVRVNRLAQALAWIAFARRDDLFDDQWRLLPKSQWPAAAAAIVEGIETEELYEMVGPKGAKRRRRRGYGRKVRTARRTEAIRLLMQWTGMIRDAEVEAMAAELSRLRELLDGLRAEREGGREQAT